jgi:hypothetical protein
MDTSIEEEDKDTVPDTDTNTNTDINNEDHIEEHNELEYKKIGNKKKNFEEKCKECSRVFNNQPRYEKHIKEQKCRTKENITYCKLCDITLLDRNLYNKHLYSMEHIRAIGIDNLDNIETNKISPINYLDPYLNKDDVNKISTKNLGDSFTLVFKSGNIKTINLVKEETKEERTEEERPTIVNENKNPEESFYQPTDRQLKILNFISSINNIENAHTKFDAILRKCNIEDYKHLQSYINKLNINNTLKESYNNVINIFINEMISRSNKGEKHYNNKEISNIVVNLSS